MAIKNSTPLSQAQLAAIGEITFWWSKAELWVDTFSSVLLRDTERGQEVLRPIQSFKTKQQILAGLLQVELSRDFFEPATIKKAQAALSNISGLSEDRNFAVHGHWTNSSNSKKRHEYVTRVPLLTRDGQRRRKYLPAKRLRHIATSINHEVKLLTDAFQELWDQLPASYKTHA